MGRWRLEGGGFVLALHAHTTLNSTRECGIHAHIFCNSFPFVAHVSAAYTGG